MECTKPENKLKFDFRGKGPGRKQGNDLIKLFVHWNGRSNLMRLFDCRGETAKDKGTDRKRVRRKRYERLDL